MECFLRWGTRIPIPSGTSDYPVLRPSKGLQGLHLLNNELHESISTVKMCAACHCHAGKVSDELSWFEKVENILMYKLLTYLFQL